jgi:hypothetical protein
MIRNMKALGLALVAVFALSAMGASAASAQKALITSPTSPFWLKGADEVATKPQLRAFGGSTKCHATYTGGKVNATNKVTGHHEGLSNGAVDFTISPTYTNCLSGTGLPETVTMNGCDFVIHNGETVLGSTDLYTVTADLVCPAGQEVTIDIYENATKHASNTVLCSIHIKPQAGLAGGTLTDEPTSGHLTLGGTVKGIHMVLTPPCVGVATTTAVGELDLEATIEGRSAVTSGGVAVPLSLSHK